MNIIVIRDRLKEAVDAVARVAGDHPTLAILKNILIEAEGDGIRLTATNLEVGMQYMVPGKVVESGSLTVPASLLMQIISSIPHDRLNLASKENTLEVATDNYHASLQTTPAEEFPLIPKVDKAALGVEIPGPVLKEAMDQVLSAAQFSELRPELSSILMKFGTDKLMFVATDSFRLAEKTLLDADFSATAEDDFQILIPLKSAEVIARLAKDKPVRIVRDGNQVLVETAGAEFISRLIDGTFPDYQAIVPKEYLAEAEVSREELLSAIKLTGVLSGASAEVMLRPAAGGKALEICSRDEKLGENTYVLQAKLKGTFEELSFNARYLSEGVKAAGSKDLVIKFNEPNRPALVAPLKDDSFFYIVMPILKA